jgi:hypothetical protein
MQFFHSHHSIASMGINAVQALYDYPLLNKKGLCML